MQLRISYTTVNEQRDIHHITLALVFEFHLGPLSLIAEIFLIFRLEIIIIVLNGSYYQS